MKIQPEGSGLGRRLAANTLHAASGRFVALVLWVVLAPVILRALGPEGFAVWSLFFTLTGWLAALDLGLAQGTLRHIAGARACGDNEAAGGFATVGVIGFVLLGVLWLALTPLLAAHIVVFLRVPQQLKGDAVFAIQVGAAVFALSGLANITIAVAQGYDRFALGNGISVVASLAQAVGIVWALRSGSGLRGLIVASGAGWLIASVVGMTALRARVRHFHWGGVASVRSRVREALAFGGPMQAASILSAAHQQLDKLLLARFVSLASVTPYELGLRIAASTATFPQLLLLAAMPAASAIHAAEPARLGELYARGNRYVLSASAVAISALLGAADPLLTAWLGGPQPEASLALRGLAITGAVALATGMGTAITRAVGRTLYEAEFAAVALGLHTLLGLLLVPRFGLAGALSAILAGNIAGGGWFLSRLANVIGSSRAQVLLEPLGWPLVATVLGAGAGLGLNYALQAPAAGVAAWGVAVACSATSAFVAAVILSVSRYLPLAEALALLRGESNA